MPMIARLIVLVSLVGFLCLNSGRAGALDLVNVVLAPLPPFVIEGGTLGAPPGIVTEILTEAYRRDGKLPKYAYMPAARAEHTVRNGRAMATVISGDSGDQANSFILSNSLLRTSVSAFIASSYAGQLPGDCPAAGGEAEKRRRAASGDIHTRRSRDERPAQRRR
jgi:hypothetical protein